jgi:VanZ family protein
MNKIFLLISLFISSHSFGQIPQDKLLHFGAGFGIGATITLTHKKPNIHIGYGDIIQKSVFAGAGIGLLKESYDASVYGNKYFDVADAAATALGSLAGSLIIYSVVKNKKRKSKYRFCPQF